MKEKIKIEHNESCLIKGCTRWLKDGSRGLCVNHRAIAGERVKKGKTTWEELESKGLARPKLTPEEYANRLKHPKNMVRYL